jgi:hypothetical protein
VMNAAKRYVRAFHRVYPGANRTGPSFVSVAVFIWAS